MRVQAVHVWPPLMKQLARPTLTALARSASSRMTTALLPPSSSATRFTVPAPTACTRLPAAVEPVNDTMSTSGCAASASPTTGPRRDEVEHARRQPHLLEHLGQRERRQRRHLAGLEHDGAPGRQRRGDLGHDLVQRVVPRRDGADDADRLLDDQRVADLLVPVVGLQDLRVGPQHLDRVAHLHGGGEPQRRPHLGGDERRDLVGPRLERVGGGRQQRRAVGAGRDAQPSNAARAAPTAASTSSAVPAGTVAICSSVAGSTTARASRPSAGTHRPLRKKAFLTCTGTSGRGRLLA
jgi:hypothetical protein